MRLIAVKSVWVEHSDGSRARRLERGESVEGDLLVARAVQEHIKQGELKPEEEKAPPTVTVPKAEVRAASTRTVPRAKVRPQGKRR